jgi:hypothetical protein
LVLIFIIGLTLRWWYLPYRNIDFRYDQARDAFAVQEIIGGQLKIQGPPTSGAPGLFHGVLYYYIIAPAYYFGQGDPLVVAYWLSFITALTIFPVFYLTYVLTKRKLPAFISGLIFAFSFDAIQFSNFMSNASLGILFVPFIYIGLLLWIRKISKWAPAITGLALGLSVQTEIAFYFYLLPVVLWLFVYKNKITRKELFWFILGFVLAVSTMIVCEVKFGFPGIMGLYYLFSSQDAVAGSKQFSDILLVFLDQAGDRLANTIFPFNNAFGAIIGFGIITYSLIRTALRNDEELLTWPVFLATYIPAHIVALPFGGSATPHIMIGAIPAISILAAIFLWELFRQNKTLLLIAVSLLLLINFSKFVKQNNYENHYNLTKDYLLSTEMKIIDYTYEKSMTKPFSISTLTTPLHINILWSYLYNWYGQEKYGYLPYWHGRDQVGQPGNNLQPASDNIDKHFFISEPAYLIPEIHGIYAKGDQDAISNLVEEKMFGRMFVQQRIRTNEK